VPTVPVEASQPATNVLVIAVTEAIETGAPAASSASSLPVPFVPVRSTSSSTLGAVPSAAQLLLPAQWLPQATVIGSGGLRLPTLRLLARGNTSAAARQGPAPTAPHATTTPRVRGTAIANGGRDAGRPAMSPVGFGFGSPIGRFAITRSGVLLGGANDGHASINLVVPVSLVLAAALVGVAAVLSQRRVERRRRVLR
jgi:hypothetical protein